MPTVHWYDTDTVDAGPLALDALALNAYLRRAWSSYGTGAVYDLGEEGGAADKEAYPGQRFDCTGWLWWCCYLDRKGTLWPPNKWWRQASGPIAGACVRHDAPPGADYGHAGIVVYVHPDGNYDTLDASSTDPKARGGAIRYKERAAAFWGSKPNMRFVVSSGAVLSEDGVAYSRPLNLLLAAAKRPLATSMLAIAAVIGAAYWWRQRKKAQRRLA